jgi:hypothetical protein
MTTHQDVPPDGTLTSLECAERRRCAKRRGTAILAAAAAGALSFAGCVTSLPPEQTQYAPPPGPAPAPVYYPETAAPPSVAPNPLDQLMAPVALYPDPLISIILPASTFPSDVESAGAYLSGGGDPGQVDGQPWDPSVRSLAHYPSVAEWMAQNGAWTQAVGAAFVSQPAEVMEAIQRLRELAQADGTLKSTPQQQVIVSGTYVEIEPAQSNVIYVPEYDPAVVFVDQPYYDYDGPFFAYGPPYEAGAWLTFGCNWGGGAILIVGPGYWRGEGGGWRHPDQGAAFVSAGARPWSFPPNRPRPQAPNGWRSSPQVVSARPIAGAPARPPQSAYRDIHTRGPAAVAAVGANPGAFKGRPINPAIIPRTSGATSAAPPPRNQFQNQSQPGQTSQKPVAPKPYTEPRPYTEPKPHTEAKPYAEPKPPAAPKPQVEPKPFSEPKVTPAPKAPTEPRPPANPPAPLTRAPGLEPAPKAETVRPAEGAEHGEGEKEIPADKKAVKPTPKPAPRPEAKPEPEKPKEDEPQH